MLSHPSTQRIAVIDLGSNTARLILMSTVPGYAYNLDDEIREVVRLREGMSESGLSAEATARALFTLRLFKDFCDSSGVDEIIATATSAVSDTAARTVTSDVRIPPPLRPSRPGPRTSCSRAAC